VSEVSEASGPADGAGPFVDLYRDRPDLYDLLHDDLAQDLEFYAGLAGVIVPPGGGVLELGCGSGRVMAALLEQELRVTGLDAEEAMLARARARLAPFGARARLLRGDMRRLAAPGAPGLGPDRFDLVLIAANTFMHLEGHDDQRACLEGIRARLNPGGTAILDLANPFHAMALPQGVVTFRRQARDEATGQTVTVTGALEVDPTAPRVLDRLFFDQCGPDGALRRLLSRVELRLVFMPELELLLGAAGLGVTDAYGDYDLGPYHKDAERMIVVIKAYD
jgi:SAM-dependent methyltransferase